MDVEDMTNEQLKQQYDIIVREMQNRGFENNKGVY